MGILEKIAEIEAEMKRTQKNKATEYHLGLLKAKLAKYRTMLLEVYAAESVIPSQSRNASKATRRLDSRSPARATPAFVSLDSRLWERVLFSAK